MREKNDQRLTFRLAADMCRQLTELSDRRGVSVGKLVRDILRAYLLRHY